MANIATLTAAYKRLRQPTRVARTTERQPTPDARTSLARLVPLPLAEVGTVLAAIGVARHLAQTALNEGLRSGELRLAHSGDDVLVVAGGAS